MTCPSDGDACNGPETCDPETGECRTATEQAVDCDDGLACNGSESCDPSNGECLPGDAPVVDDGVRCTIDTCVEPDGQVAHTPDDEQCAADPCVIGRCAPTDAGADPVSGCVFEAREPETDGLACTEDICDPASGQTVHTVIPGYCLIAGVCVVEGTLQSAGGCLACNGAEDARAWTAVLDGLACDDGDYCTVSDTCRVGVCRGEDRDCSAVVADTSCEGARCDESLDECVVVAHLDGTTCDDGDYCNGQERCQSGECQPGPSPDLTTIEACVTLTCDSLLGVQRIPRDGPCDDGDACTEADSCTSGLCTGETIEGCCHDDEECDDSDPCTDDRCAEHACVHETNDACGCVDGAACDDGDPCTSGDVCDEGTCTGTPYDCPGGPCVVSSSCDGAGGCDVQYAAPGDTCDDGDGCTHSDRCDVWGDCTGIAYRCEPEVCRIDGACDGSGGCSYTSAADGTPCDDGDSCTAEDACRDGQCAGEPRECDDEDACTDDRCVAGVGCVNETHERACDDGNACTEEDRCREGRCLGVPLACDDNNDCTADACDPLEGCTHEPKDGPCDDDNPCTQNVCSQGVCVVVAEVEGCCLQDSDCEGPIERCEAAMNVCAAITCAACSEDEDCGWVGNRCVALGGDRVCLVGCASGGASDCPQGAVCTVHADDELCLPETMTCAAGGGDVSTSDAATGQLDAASLRRDAVDGGLASEVVSNDQLGAPDRVGDSQRTADGPPSLKDVKSDATSAGDGGGSGGGCSASSSTPPSPNLVALLLVGLLVVLRKRRGGRWKRA